MQNSRIVVLKRTGAPPLRLRADLYDRHELLLSDMQSVSIELWQRPNGAFAVAIARIRNALLTFDASAVDSLTDAMEFVERQVVSSAGSQTRIRDRSCAEASEVFRDRLHQIDEQRAFERLAGEALACWDDALQGGVTGAVCGKPRNVQRYRENLQRGRHETA